MNVPFEIPDWLLDASASQAPPDTSGVDPHRVEDLVNRFIAGKQEALFNAPDAYYRTTGRDAVDGAPGILDRLNGLEQATLEAAPDDGMRFVLSPRLDAHLDDAGDGIDRHVAAQRDALTRQIISERQRLIQNAATLEHNNDNKLAASPPLTVHRCRTASPPIPACLPTPRSSYVPSLTLRTPLPRASVSPR